MRGSCRALCMRRDNRYPLGLTKHTSSPRPADAQTQKCKVLAPRTVSGPPRVVQWAWTMLLQISGVGRWVTWQQVA